MSTMCGDDEPGWSPAWIAPQDAPPELASVYRILGRMLQAASSALPGLLSEPGRYPSERIYKEVRLKVLSRTSGLDDTQRVAVLNALTGCLARLDPAFHPKTAIFHAPPPNPFPKSPSEAVATVHRVTTAFSRMILAHGRSDLVKQLEPPVQLGLLVTSIVLRQAQCAPRVLVRLAETLDMPLNIAGPWFYRDVSIAAGPRTPAERRRIFLDVVSAALYVNVRPECTRLLARPAGEKLGVQSRRRLATLGKCFAAFMRVAAPDDGHPPSLQGLLVARLGALRMSVCSVLADYASGALVSSSFREAAFLRFAGFRPTAPLQRETARVDSGMSSLTRDSREDHLEQVYRGVFDAGGLLADLRRIIHQPPDQWVAALNRQLAALPQPSGPESAPVLLIRWLIQLASKRRPGGRKAARGTVLNMLGTLGSRLLEAWPTDGFGASVQVDDLQEVYAAILETAVSPGHLPRLAAILSDFDRFYRAEVHPELKAQRPELTVDGGYYEISADALSIAEYKRLRSDIYGPASPFSTGRRRHQALVFVALAWRLGMRRSEITGLQRRDIQWDDQSSRFPGYVLIRNNGLRTLKTSNSRRLVPTSLLEPKELKYLRFLYDQGPKCDPGAALFQDPGSGERLPDAAIVEGVNQLLHRVTGGAAVHPHNLRHAFASFAFMAMLAGDVGLKRYVEVSPFVADVISLRRKVAAAILNRFRPYGSKAYALSRMLGHGSLEMTFLCYVHTLDILLFAATDRTEARGDRKFQRALGIPDPRRRRGRRGDRPLGRLPRTSPGRVVIHRAIDSEEPLAPRAEPGFNLPGLIKLHARLADTLSKDRANNALVAKFLDLPVPTTPAQRLAAIAAITTLNSALARDDAATKEAVRLWAVHKLARDHWASFDAAEVVRFISAFGASTNGPANVETMEVRGVPGTKRKRMTEVPPQDILRLATASVAARRYWARLRDNREATVRRKLDSAHRVRQSTQASVSWVLLGVSVASTEAENPAATVGATS